MAVRAAEPAIPLPIDASEIMTAANELVGRHRFGRALNLLERSVGYGAGTEPPSWEFRNLRASLFLLSGDPGRARAVWDEEDRQEHKADVARQLANVAFVEGRDADATASYRAALDDGAPEAARYGLALALLEQHDAAGFIGACDAASRSGKLASTAAEFCRDVQSTAAPYAEVRPQRVRPAGSVDRR
jgi:tetratricopeptide (TPR) repeat protein